MAYSEAQKEASRKWNEENYDKLTVYLPKGMNDRLMAAAQVKGVAKRQFIADALNEAIEKTKEA